MKKRIVSLILILSITIGFGSVGIAREGLNDNLWKEEIYLNENKILMLPLRSSLESLNYQVKWNEKDKSIDVLKDKEKITLKIDSEKVRLGEEIVKLENKPILKDGKTFIPAELLSKTLDLIVGLNIKHEHLDIREETKNQEEFFNISKEKEIKEKINDYMEALEKHENFHGSVLVAKDGKLLLNEAYGFSDFKQNTINKSKTRFAIGSLTKQFAAVGILKLSEEGLVNLDDFLVEYMPDFPHSDKITIHNLLTHTSGLKNYTDLPGFLEVDEKNKDPMKMIDLIRDIELGFEPGEKFEYSNTNYLALGMVIEKASGKSFEDYLGKIFLELDMKDTGMIYGKKQGMNDATPYVGYLEVKEIDDDGVLSQAYAAGSMYSTVEDLYKWDRAINSGKILKGETKKEMFKEHISISEKESYGYGWMINNKDIGREIYHGGNTQGFTSYMGRLEEQDISIIILTNVGLYNTNALKEDIISIMFEEDYENPQKLEPIEIEDKELYNIYSGKYEFIEGLELNIIEKENKLYIQIPGMESFEIYPKSTSEFFGKIVDAKVEFKTKDELTLSYGGMEFICKRIGELEEKKQVEIDPRIYDEYIGEYDLSKASKMIISKEGDKLYARLTGQDAFEIFPSSEIEFFYKTIDANITFIKDENGRVSNLLLKQSGQEINLPKLK